MSQQKIMCVDCKYYKPDHIPSCRCSRKGQLVRGLVDNEVSRTTNMLDPYQERNSGWLSSRLFDDCGREGRYFEPK